MPIRRWRMITRVVIVETTGFTKRIRELWKDDTYREFQNHLVSHPSAGVVIPGAGGLRKVRWAGSGRGKRGGTRIIYFSHPPTSRLLMLFVFGKNERDDLTADQKKMLRKIIQSEYP